MSYILEALKKSEQERARDQGTLPDIKSVHTPSSTLHEENRRWWPVVLIVVIIVASAGLTALYFTRLQPAETVVEREQNAPALAMKSQETQKAVKKQIANPVAAQLPKTQVPQTQISSKSSVKENDPPAKEQKQPRVVFSKQQLQRDDVIGNVKEQQDQEVEQTLQPSTPAEVKQNADPTAVAISDIPDSVRRKIPDISFEGHVYSSNLERRSVMINGHKRREGDTIGGDLLLKEITANGAEFEIEGYRFRLNALQDWSFK